MNDDSTFDSSEQSLLYTEARFHSLWVRHFPAEDGASRELSPKEKLEELLESKYGIYAEVIAPIPANAFAGTEDGKNDLDETLKIDLMYTDPPRYNPPAVELSDETPSKPAKRFSFSRMIARRPVRRAAHRQKSYACAVVRESGEGGDSGDDGPPPGHFPSAPRPVVLQYLDTLAFLIATAIKQEESAP